MTWEMIRAGGVVLLVTMLCSLLAGLYIVWLFVIYSRARRDLDREIPDLLECVRKGQTEEAKQRCEVSPSVIMKMFGAGLEARSKGSMQVERAIAEELEYTVLPELRKGFGVLTTVAKLAPMLGLFGTVLGMTQAFAKIAGTKNINPQELADSIGLALVTTVGGLAVAIPIIGFHAYFVKQFQEKRRLIQKYVQEMIDIVS